MTRSSESWACRACIGSPSTSYPGPVWRTFLGSARSENSELNRMSNRWLTGSDKAIAADSLGAASGAFKQEGVINRRPGTNWSI